MIPTNIFRTGVISPEQIKPVEEEKKTTAVSAPRRTTITIEEAKTAFQEYVSQQPPIISQIIKPEEKKPEIITVGKKEVVSPSDFKPFIILRDPRKYFEERLPPPKQPSYSWISEKIPATRGVEFGYYPPSSELTGEISLLGQQIKEAEIGLRDVKIFIYDFPKYKKRYEEAVSMVTSAEKAPPGKAYWFDLNLNKIPEKSELFTEPMFQFKGETALYTKEEALQKLRTDWEKVEKQYSELTIGKGRRKLEVDIKKLKETKYTLEEYRREGWKFEKKEGEGYLFTQPTTEEIYSFIRPGEAGVAHLAGVAATEAFPSVIPLKAMGAGLFTPVSSIIYRPEAVKGYVGELQEKALAIERKPGETGWEYTGRFWHPFSESGVGMNIYLPVITMGASYVYSGLTTTVSGGGKVISSIGKVGQTFPGQLMKTGIKTAGYTATIWGVGLTGVSFGIVAARQPEQLPYMLGETAIGLSKVVGGWTLGQYLHGRGVPPVAKDISGRPKTSTKTLYEDVSFSTTKEGQIKFVRKGIVETTYYGEKPGTSFKTRTAFRLKGQATPIGEEIVATRIEGITVKGEGQIFGKTYRSAQIQKMIETGKLNIVESFGISKKIGTVKGMDVTIDKAVSGIYGKSSEVITSRGGSVFKELETGTKGIVLEAETIKPKGIKISLGKTATIQYGKYAGYSFGTYESPHFIGVYQDIGISYMIKGVTPGAEIAALGEGGAALQPYTQAGTGSLKSISFKGKTVQKTTSIGKTVETGAKVIRGAETSFKFLPLENQIEQPVTYGSKEISFMEMEAPGISRGIIFGGIITPIQISKTFQRKKPGTIISQISEVKVGVKGIIMQTFKPEISEEKYRSQLRFVSIGEEMETRRIQLPGLLRASALKMRQLRITELALSQKLETISVVKPVVPSITTPFMPTPIPPIFKGKGQYEPGLKKKRGFSWGRLGKKELSLKTVLADPFSVMESQIKFGKATHPLPTKKVWMEAEAHGWKLGTVELRKKIKKMKIKKIKFKFKKKRGKKK